MGWPLLVASILLLASALFVVKLRRAELGRIQARLDERSRAIDRGSHRARLQYPHVDLSRCLGCGSCVRACPEDGVLELIHGQAMVVHGARCVGHGRCAAECPTGAIVVALGDLEERRDIPALTESFEVPGTPGLFLAGEVTGYALIRTAIAHGTAVAGEVARRERVARPASANGTPYVELCIVGAGPAGLACALEAKRRGLSFVILDQDELGGTVAKYPRRKLVMTQPVELPLVGELSSTSYAKEELMTLWREIATEFELPIRTGVRLEGVERHPSGVLCLRTTQGAVLAGSACLALGRRGTPRKLGVPGEELPKVAYSLLDAQAYQGRRILVVGGGDSAVEAALGLAEQDENDVVISYRKAAFSRLKARNEKRLDEAVAARKLRVLYQSEVARITPETVELDVEEGCSKRRVTLENDEVFVFAGGIPPFELLELCGVSFDPADRPRAAPVIDRGTGLARSLAFALALALLVLAWALAHVRYYVLPLAQRPAAAEHAWLAPSSPLGLTLGVSAVLLVCANLAYLARRSPRLRWALGTLRQWMTVHLVTGVLAFLCALVHGALAPRDTLGGHALWALAVLVTTGAIGRYFYAFVPRAANGRELAYEEVQSSLASLSADLDRENRELAGRVRARVDALVARESWRGGFLARVAALARAQRRLRGALAELEREAGEAGLSRDQIAGLVLLARRAQLAALLAAHYEDLRGLLSTWRWVHRWAALLLVLLVIAHVVVALRYGSFWS